MDSVNDAGSSQSRWRDCECSFGFKVAGFSRAHHAGKQFASRARRHHEPAFILPAPTVPYPDRSVPAKDSIRNVVRIDSTLSEVLKAVVREDERPIQPRARHTTMVCILGCEFKWKRGR